MGAHHKLVRGHGYQGTQSTLGLLSALMLIWSFTACSLARVERLGEDSSATTVPPRKPECADAGRLAVTCADAGPPECPDEGDALGLCPPEAECHLERGSQIPQRVDKSVQLLTSDKVWVVSGMLYVDTMLEIEPCTRIELTSDGEYPGGIVVRKGGKLVANGAAKRPILFTTNGVNSGDWQHETDFAAGLYLLGRAPSGTDGNRDEREHEVLDLPPGMPNQYGGAYDQDNSGTLSYVRIEGSGGVTKPSPAAEAYSDGRYAGLFLAGVGSGTTISHVMVRRTRGECFEFFGGTANADHLICDQHHDDATSFSGFKVYGGHTGTLRFLFARTGRQTDGRGLTIGSEITPWVANTDTATILRNLTLCSRGESDTVGIWFYSHTRADIAQADVLGFQEAQHIASGTATNRYGIDTGPFNIKDCLAFNGADPPIVVATQSGAFSVGSDWQLTSPWIAW